MKKGIQKTVSFLLVLLFIYSGLPMAFLASAYDYGALRVYRSAADVHGSDHTYSTSLAAMLDQVFNGDIELYKNAEHTEKVSAYLGNSEAVKGGDTRFVQGGAPCESCFAYANAVYKTLYGDYPGHYPHGISSSYPNSDIYGAIGISYDSFKNVGLRTCAYFRNSIHSFLILSYNQNRVFVLDGNWVPGTPTVREYTWDQFIGFVYDRGSSIEYIANPKEAFFNERYFPLKDYNFGEPSSTEFQTSKDNVAIHDGPYANKKIVRRIEKKGTLVKTIACFKNSKKNMWYKTDQGDWIWSGNVCTKTTYPITYDANGGQNAPVAQTKIQGVPINLSQTIPTKTFKQFMGWSADKKAKTAQYKAGATYTPDASVKLYAVWKWDSTGVKLSNYNSSLCVNDTNKAETITMTLTRNLPKGSRIVPEYDNSIVSVSVDDISNQSVWVVGKVTANTKITAKSPGNCTVTLKIISPDGDELNRASVYVQVTKKYYVSYNANGGSAAPAQQIKWHHKTSLVLTESMPNRTNFEFLGWAESADASFPAYGPGDLYQENKDVTFYAVWKENYHVDAVYDAGSKTLTISGLGDMANYSLQRRPQWDQYASKAENLVVESGITSIGTYAFYNFKALKKVTLNYSVSRVQNYAFSGCNKLESVKAREGLNCGNRAFSDCFALKAVMAVLNSGLKNKVNRVNAKNESETAEIGAFAFENCSSLESFDFAGNTTAIGSGAFSGCTSLDNIVIPESVTKLEDTVFFGCSSLETIDIPDSVTDIEDGVFTGCSSLSEIEIPDSVETLGDQVFSGCSSLSTIEIPEGVEYIGSSVFSNCTALSEVALPDTLNYLGDSMFAGCTSLSTIEIPENINSIGDGSFSNCTGLSEITIPERVSVIGTMSFTNCKSLTSFEAFDDVTSIEDYAFSGCTGLRSIAFSNKVEEIGCGAFMNCTALESVQIPEGMEIIEMGAFMNCTSLRKVEFEDAPITIEDEAFAGCTVLSNVTLPETTISVSNSAFSSCGSNFGLTCYSTAVNYEEIVNSGINYTTIYPVEGIELSVEKNSLNQNETLQVTPIFTPLNATNQTIEWVSENEDIATVNQNGVVTAVGSGVATIKATTQDRNHVASVLIDCIIPCEDIQITNPMTELEIGSRPMLFYLFTPESPTDIDVEWSSSAPDVLTVDEMGILNAIKPGEATITVSASNGTVKDSILVKVNELPVVQNLRFDPSSIRLKIGDESTITAKYDSVKEVPFIYYSSDESVLSVDFYGHVVALSEGEADIYTGYGEQTAVCHVTVEKKTNCENGNHTYDAGVITKQPTCIEPGVMTYTCTVCEAGTAGHSYTVSIPATGEHYDVDNDGLCDGCNKQMTGGGRCKYCGQFHTGFAGFFTKIIHFFMGLFGGTAHEVVS